MNEMIERVAKAIQAAMCTHTAGMASDHELGCLAQAAIQAMREPTDAMIEAGKDTDQAGRYSVAPAMYDLMTLFQAMIDAALK